MRSRERERAHVDACEYAEVRLASVRRASPAPHASDEASRLKP